MIQHYFLFLNKLLLSPCVAGQSSQQNFLPSFYFKSLSLSTKDWVVGFKNTRVGKKVWYVAASYCLVLQGTLTCTRALWIRQQNQKAILCLSDGSRYICPSSRRDRRDNSRIHLCTCCVQYDFQNLSIKFVQNVYKFCRHSRGQIFNQKLLWLIKSFYQQELFQKQK